MASFQIVIPLELTPTEAYEEVCELSNGHLWSHVHHDWIIQPPGLSDLNAGDQVHHTATIWGVPLQLRWEITQVNRPKGLTLEGTARHNVDVKMTVAITRRRPHGSKLTVTTEILGGPPGSAEQFAQIAELAQRHSLEKLAAGDTQAA